MPPSETQSLIRAVAILDCFQPQQPELGVSEIARRLKMSRSTVGRLLSTMHSVGILAQNKDTRRYRMGSKVLLWSTIYMSRLDLAHEARPALNELHRMTRETVSVYALDGTERVCIDRIESPESMRVVVHPGERMPLHAGSAGKALLAFMTPEAIKQVLASPLEPMTPHTITNRKKLLAELESIRACGYATSHSERFEDVLGLAAPIFDAEQNIIAALNVAGPATRFTDSSIDKFAPLIKQLADQVSRALGCLESPLEF